LAAATLRGESVALIDTFDRFDPPTADACGIELSRLLWVRGQAVSKTAVAIDPAWLPGVRAVNGPGTFMERVIDRAIKSLNLVVQSGVCTLVVLDLIDVPAVALRRLPASTWFRIERAIEGSDTAVLILAAMPVARSAGGRSIAMQAGSGEPGAGSPSTSLRAGRTSVLPAPDSRLPAPGFTPVARRYCVASPRISLISNPARSSRRRSSRLEKTTPDQESARRRRKTCRDRPSTWARKIPPGRSTRAASRK
jgi:hypothetical protein